MDYDQQMNVLAIKDELGQSVESCQLDLQDRPVSITNVEGRVMSLTWGLKSMVKTIARFDGTTNSFAYDEGQRISQIAYPDDSISLTYFNNNLPKAISNHWGSVTNNYDGANRLTVQSQPVPNGTLAYGYYPAGQLFNVVSVAGTNTYVLDSGDRLQTLQVKSSTRQDSIGYSYDTVNGMLAQASYSNGLKCSYTFDAMDRVTGISWMDVSNRVLKSRTYAYTAAGMISNVVLESDEKVTYSYDSLDRLTRERHTDYYGQVISDQKYEYDLAGNRTNKIILDANGDTLLTVNYSLPTANKLGSWTVPETNLAARFSVMGSSSDPIGVGSRYGKLWVSNSLGGCLTPYVDGSTNFYAFDMTCGMGTQYVYAAIRDTAGNTTYVTNRFFPTCLTNGSYQYNSAGCLTNRQYTGKDYVDNLSLTWNSQYQLTGVSTNGVLAESYGYDGVGRRIFLVENGTTNWMVYDGNQVVAEVDNSGNLKKSYVYGLGIDNPISMTVFGTTTNTYYFLKDHLGSTLALTDASGNIVESYRYDAWGRVLGVYGANGAQMDESAVGNRILWQGREYSFKTGLYYFRARWYDPVTGRFISKDPSGIVNGLNEYVALNNNPVNFADPTGEAAIEAYDYWADAAVSGQDAGGVLGHAQTAGASVMMAFIDFWGARDVEGSAGMSGYYSGSDGCKGKSAGYGLYAAGMIGINAIPGGKGIGKAFSKDAAALIDLAREAKRAGVSAEEAKTLLEWAREYGVHPARGPEIHPARNFKRPHVHVGPVDHIPVGGN